MNESKNKSKIKSNSKSIELNISANINNTSKSKENLNKSKKSKNQNKSDGEINFSIMKDSKEKTRDNLGFEKIEMSNGISYEYNAIDFIKYALRFSFLENEVAIP